MCKLCDQLAARVMTSDEWDQQHAEHGDKRTEPFPHPSGEWIVLVCPCGARHVRSKA